MKIIISTTVSPADRALLGTALQAAAARVSAGENAGSIGGHTDYAAQPEGQPIAYLALADIAAFTHLSVETVKTYRKRAVKNRAMGHPLSGDLPEPDAQTGGTPGWLLATIVAWRDRVQRREAAAE